MDILDATLRIQELALQISEEFEPFVAEEGLTLVTAHTLWNIQPRRTDLTMSELAAALRCNASNATFLVTQLEHRGYAERKADPADGRRKVVVLTDAGARVRNRLGDALTSVSPLKNLTEHERATLAHIIAAISA
ncbi:MarR family winged helix-turn-helix transcriptional regulator [Nocardia australiensis]|uniref:MarR family winged helix-turn-helix transcriptional regulator n=1 Tax=Nocardia australiensis TaxID=2887191 RepID=UPI001D13B5F7|nr:MarR family transcriptional regulator [Nocardia australiensis]